MALSGTLLRDINQLPLSPKAMSIAKELDSQIDMPVIFWMDYPGARNDAGRMPDKHNQYWVTVKPQSEQKEFDRIVLHNMFRGLLNTRRAHSLIIDNEYLSCQTNQRLLIHFCNHINAFATTEICRLYFNKRGIYTSARTRRIKFNGLAVQATRIKFSVSPDSDLTALIPMFLFVLDISVYAFIDTKFRQKIPNVLGSVSPKESAVKIQEYMYRIVDLLRENQQNFVEDRLADSLVFLYNGICSVFDLPEAFHIETYYDYYEGSVPVNGIEQLYSFIPDEISNRPFFVKCIKYINTILCVMQEGIDTFEHKRIIDFHVNIADSGIRQAYADGNIESGYFITITKPFLNAIKDFSDTCTLPAGIPDNTEVYGITFRERIFKCMLFAAVLHEYAHILNGDCDNNNTLSKPEREKRADDYSKQLFLRYVFLQYRCDPNEITDDEIQSLTSNLILDQSAFDFSLFALNTWRSSQSL